MYIEKQCLVIVFLDCLGTDSTYGHLNYRIFFFFTKTKAVLNREQDKTGFVLCCEGCSQDYVINYNTRGHEYLALSNDVFLHLHVYTRSYFFFYARLKSSHCAYYLRQVEASPVTAVISHPQSFSLRNFIRLN